MKHAYSDEFSSPPALILPVEIRIRHDARPAYACRGKIDTAADMTVVPRLFVEQFRPAAVRAYRIRQTGRWEYSYLLEIELDGKRWAVEAIAHDIPYVLVGRDILNQLKLVADGPKEVFEISW
jgi:hypothetical protein